ncbi:MAG: 4-hydroxyphenylacetate 3-hydroxylase N-terminal domain-containing protein [Acidimicrobiales bacterium]
MGIRTGDEYLAGLRATSREIWLGSEKVESVADHPMLRPAAETLAAYYDLHHRLGGEMVVADPDDGEPMSVSHLQPRSREDLARRHVALTHIAELTMGTMGRTPDYMNVTFAGFAQDEARWAGPDGVNDEGYENLVAFQRRLRRDDLALTHTIVQPTVDKATDNDFAAHPAVPVHKVGETSDSIIVRGARVLATLAPFADENAVYPGAPLPSGAPPEYALAFSVPMDSPGMVFLCRDSATRNLDPFDAPFSSWLDEQDAYCIFDDVEIPKSDVWIDAKPEIYNSVMFTSPWWPNIMQQTTIRALTKLEFIYGLALRMTQAVNDTSEKTLQLLGEIQIYVELTRSSLLIAEERMITWESGNVTPEARALHPLRAQLPAWFVRVNDILKEIGSSKLLATAARGQLDDPRIGPLLEEFLPGAEGIDPEQRAAVFRMGWDLVGTLFGGRNELYERNYLGATGLNRMLSQRLYSAENQERGGYLVDKFLAEAANRAGREERHG